MESLVNLSKCQAIISSGNKKGSICDRLAHNGVCGYHSRRLRKTNTKTENSIKSESEKTPSKSEKVLHKKTFKSDSNECPICLESYEKDFITFKCGHGCDIGCIVQIENGLCPLCRAPITGVPTYVSEMLNKNLRAQKEINELKERLSLLRQNPPAMLFYQSEDGSIQQFMTMFSSTN